MAHQPQCRWTFHLCEFKGNQIGPDGANFSGLERYLTLAVLNRPIGMSSQ
jgi:hypothetical protein